MKAQQFAIGKKLTSPKKKVYTLVTLQPDRQTFVIITTDHHGLIFVEHIQRIFDCNMCLVGTDVLQVTPNMDFHILVTTLGKI